MSNRTIQAAVIAPDGQRHHITVTAAAPGPLDQGIATISNASLQAALKAPPHKSEPPSIPHRPDTICPDCDGAGFYKEAVPFGHPNFSKLLPCHCKLADQQVYARKRQTEILDKLQGELGGRLSRATFQNYTIPHDYELRERQKLQAARQACQAFVSDPRGWLYLYGPTGTGKSHLAAATALELARQGWRVAYASVPKLLRYIKAGFADRTSDDRLLALQLVDLLVLDDLGTEYHRDTYDYNDQALFELLNERDQYDRSTIITSNSPRADLEPRIRSRIAIQTRELHLDAPDYREKLLNDREAEYGLPESQRGAA